MVDLQPGLDQILHWIAGLLCVSVRDTWRHRMGDVWRWLPSWRKPSCGRPSGEVERPWQLALWELPYVYAPLGTGARARARIRGTHVARHTLGEAVWHHLQQQGYLDVRSTHIPGLTYRVRVGRRVQLLWDHPEAARLIPWPVHGYLCIQPTYPLPAVEFAAQLVLYLNGDEAKVIRVAIPQAADGPLRRVF
jgi:hypothetical protein